MKIVSDSVSRRNREHQPEDTDGRRGKGLLSELISGSSSLSFQFPTAFPGLALLGFGLNAFAVDLHKIKFSQNIGIEPN